MKAHIIERSAKYSLILIWVFSITIALPMLFFRRLYGRHWKNHAELWCDDDWSLTASETTPGFHRPARITYYTIICLVLFIFPIMAMIGAYCGIIRTLWLNQVPGERITHDISGQMKMKRKVGIITIILWLILIKFGDFFLFLREINHSSNLYHKISGRFLSITLSHNSCTRHQITRWFFTTIGNSLPRCAS